MAKALVALSILALQHLLPVVVRNSNPFDGVLWIKGESSELSDTVDGSTVNPFYTLGPSGTLFIHGTGSVNFDASGVRFLQGGQQATNDAYYKFTGATVANIFPWEKGEIQFTIKSSYSWDDRKNFGIPESRFVYDVYDGNGQKFVFYPFIYNDVPLRLKWVWGQAGGATDYATPAGTEEALYGLNVSLNVKITYDGSNHAASAGVANLYFNDVLVQTNFYTWTAANFDSSSVFIFGSQKQPEGYFSFDDKISNFKVWAR